MPLIGRRNFLTLSAAAAASGVAGLGKSSQVLAALSRMGRTKDHLAIGLSAPLTSLDPHAHSYSPNMAFAQHIFDPLILPDGHMGLTPGLATEWHSDERGCRLTLRQGVRFHDGSPVTVDDVAASLRRIVNDAGPRFGLASKLTTVTQIIIESPTSIYLATAQPDPYLPRTLTSIAVIPARFEKTPTAIFDTGQAMIGSGPYRLLSGSLGTDFELAINPNHWGEQAPWKRVSLRYLSLDADRVTALLSGQVDLIDAVPPADASRMAANAAIRISSAPSSRIIYLGFDLLNQVSPFVTATDGSPLTQNPFRDSRVRLAASMAIDRDAIVREVLLGLGTPANQPVPLFFTAANRDLPALPYDLGKARSLLRDAGWADGFKLTLHCPDGRYVEDVEVANTIAVMLGRIGIDTTVAPMPPKAFFDGLPENRYSAYLSGLASTNDDTSDILRVLLMTKDQQGRGGINTGWSDPTFDSFVMTAQSTLDDTGRIAVLNRALAYQAATMPIIPLHAQLAVWAMNSAIGYDARADEYTLAQCAHWVKE